MRVLLFDWGDTVMRVLPYPGAMAGWPRVEATPGIEQALQRLHGRYTLVLATNAADSGHALVRAALQRANLDQYFDFVLTARELGVRKPDPAFFAAVLEQVGGAPAEAIMIGDDYDADVAGAKQAGLAAIWYNPASAVCPSRPPLHDGEVRSMDRLPALLTIEEDAWIE